MSTAPIRVYAARLVGLPIFDPQGDQVGKVRDLVVAIRSEASQPRVLGMVAEVFGRRRIFVPMTRVTNIDAGHIYTTGLLNMRRFEQRSTETLVVGESVGLAESAHCWRGPSTVVFPDDVPCGVSIRSMPRTAGVTRVL